jgi:RNA polymerase sigma-70 factor, ECF subfamily
MSLADNSGSSSEFSASRAAPHTLHAPGGARVLEPAARVRLQAALAHLPDLQRYAIMMWRFEGLAYEDIALVLGTSVQTVKSLLWRARENLRLSVMAPAGI